MSRQILPVEVDWKAGASPGEVEGFASVFGNVDLEGDVVMPGAFRKTISDWKHASQPMPLIADHQLDTDGVIGSVVDLAERARGQLAGLWFKARFARTQKAQDVRQNVLDGHIRGTSFTYEPIRWRPGTGSIGGKAVRRFLDELRAWEITLSPFPVNQLAGVTDAKAVVDRPWDGSASRFTPEQYRRSCLIDTGQGDVDSKDRYKLPVREPDGDLNRNALGPAAGALAGARGGLTGVSTDQKKAAARKLIRLYGEADMEPPEGVRRMAGMMSASMEAWLESMQQAIAIRDEFARKAAIDELIANHPADELPDLAAGPQDAAVTADDAAPQGTSTIEDDAYAVSFLNRTGPPDGAPTGEPPDALPGQLAALERDRSNAQIDSIESEMARELARALATEHEE